MRSYELLMVLDPEADEERVGGVVDRVKRVLADSGGEVTEENSWGQRKLAYAIGKFSEGHYYLAQLQMEPDQTSELERSLNLAEDVIRHMLVLQETRPVANGKEGE